MTERFYRGFRMRSGGEVRWAAFFDQVGWQWEYEPPGLCAGGGYIPDFLLYYAERPLLIEAKPGEFKIEDLYQYVPKIVAAQCKYDVAILLRQPLDLLTDRNPLVGIYGACVAGGTRHWSSARLCKCTQCFACVLVAEEGDLRCPSCGFVGVSGTDLVARWWAKACALEQYLWDEGAAP